jgi:hypothetical protein
MIDLIYVPGDDDEENTLDFAAPYEREVTLNQSMLFSKWMNRKGGKVEIIAVPYQKGSHMCTSIVQVLSLLLFLQVMCKDGILHGDIRGRNILFLGNDPTEKEYVMDDYDPTKDDVLVEDGDLFLAGMGVTKRRLTGVPTRSIELKSSMVSTILALEVLRKGKLSKLRLNFQIVILQSSLLLALQ